MDRSKFALVALVTLMLAGCGGSSTRTAPYKPAARPSLPAQVLAPPADPCTTGDNHALGQCLPHPAPATHLRLAQLAGQLCVDLSNNDPIYGLANWRRIASYGVRCAIFKVSEGTGFVDSTAAPMARDAKAAGLIVSGYDFQHVCQDSAASEASVFASSARADGLTGAGTMHSWGDVEFGNRSCNARVWETTWHNTVTRLLGREPGTYTGAWFWDPEFGCGYWSGGDSWISGYGVASPARPCGHDHLDMWQNTDRGFNGVSSADRSVWLDAASYQRAVGVAPKPKATKAQVRRWTRARASSHAAYVARGCPQLAQRIAWFGSHLRGKLKASRQRAYRASVRVWQKRGCVVFRREELYFAHLLKGTS